MGVRKASTWEPSSAAQSHPCPTEMADDLRAPLGQSHIRNAPSAIERGESSTSALQHIRLTQVVESTEIDVQQGLELNEVVFATRIENTADRSNPEDLDIPRPRAKEGKRRKRAGPRDKS
jgi:hypothetical protein